jgi:hypothetical protein
MTFVLLNSCFKVLLQQHYMQISESTIPIIDIIIKQNLFQLHLMQNVSGFILLIALPDL